jgi:glycosyltransferase involved in cell wall biosynthesis
MTTFMLSLILGSYSILLCVFIWVWVHKPQEFISNTSTIDFSVLIPIRNEELTIVTLLKDLEAQQYPKKLFEVIIINDQSTDKSKEKILEFASNSQLDIKLFDLIRNENSTAPKKEAITLGIKNSKFEHILCTDGDCRVSEFWLESYAKIYQRNKPKFVSGPVSFITTKVSFLNKIWHHFQVVEFASLTGTGACSIFLNQPNMCSGANISYPKNIFDEVDGFEGNLDIASGDDEFLMHKIFNKYPNDIHYLKDFDAVVNTESLATISMFYNQRKRWASKWDKYQMLGPTLLALYIVIVNFCSIYVLFTEQYEYYLLRCLPEFFFLFSILNFYKKRTSIIFIPLVQLFYPFYVLFFGLIVQFDKNYIWKTRKLK